MVSFLSNQLKNQEKLGKTMIHIRPFEQSDFAQVQQIYQQGIDTGHATFELKAKSWNEWNQSMLDVCRLVAVEDDQVLAWAGLSAISGRAVYAGVTEVSIYVATASHGKGIGSRLMAELVSASEANGIWMLQAGLFPENIGSMALHQKHGFRIVGLREKIGKMADVWRNSVLLERRSPVVM